ncbi:hypothetical protein ACFWR9_19665 [Streptomyces sp. NPDC058534]|uniref:hypothetical protein n=1 Tax=Streptomyces sp. NPDC058534 TaxID=3346541 RepID=UPI003660A8F7
MNAATHHKLWSPKPIAVVGRNIAAMPPAMTRSPAAANRASLLSAAANRAVLTTATTAETAANVQVRAELPIVALRIDRAATPNAPGVDRRPLAVIY